MLTPCASGLLVVTSAGGDSDAAAVISGIEAHVRSLKMEPFLNEKNHLAKSSNYFFVERYTLPETNIVHPCKIPSKWWIFQPAVLVYRSVFGTDLDR